MFKSIARYIEHVLVAMVKGFIFMGLAAAVVTLGSFLLLAHRLPQTPIEIVLTVLVVGLSAFLGLAIGLVYRLTHIEEISHAVSHMAEAAEKQRRQR